MLNRAEIVDKNFIARVSSGQLPAPTQTTNIAAAGLSATATIDLLESQFISRHTDFAARLLKERNESYYTIGSSGHEGNAVVGRATSHDDMAFLHYRSGAFYVQRAKKVPGVTPVYDLMLSLSASSEDPISGGRHKVFGSVPLFIPPQTSTIASHLPKALGTAIAIRRAQDLGLTGKLPSDSIILCSFGDASANHATALSAFNSASYCAYQRIPAPILFLCEDNGIGISVRTPVGWIEHTFRDRPGLRYFRADGRHLAQAFQATCEAVQFVRRTRQPAFLHMDTVRLLGHAGSDMESQYNPLPDIERAEGDDPLLHSARLVMSEGLMSAPEVLALYESVRARVNRVGEIAITRPKLSSRESVQSTVIPTRRLYDLPPPLPSEQSREQVFGNDWQYRQRPYHMAKLINWALHDIMLRYPSTLVFGEDVAQKGGVYHVTSGLVNKFGIRRVFNSLLDETSILGAAIGYAHNSFIPIPEIQFLAYFHNAEDQLRGEAATLPFFSQGQYLNPMVIRVAGLAYQKGFGGHFHNDNSLAVFRDIPGVVIACPSNGRDAALMLRRAVKEAYLHGRIVVFIEPIALYMTKDLLAPGDNQWSFQYPDPDEDIELGDFSVHGAGEELAIVTYGNGCYLSRQAAVDIAQRTGVDAKVIDLRWLAPLNEERLASELRGTRRILVVDECRRTGSQSEGIVALLAERLGGPAGPQIQRVVASDCFIPLGKSATISLPSREEIRDAALAMLQKTNSAVLEAAGGPDRSEQKIGTAKKPTGAKPPAARGPGTGQKAKHAIHQKPAKKEGNHG